MKSITFLLVFCLVIITGCKTSRPVAEINTNESQKPESMTDNTHQAVNYSEQSTWLLGYFNPVQLKREPHSVWFYKGYDEYQPAPEAINSLNGINQRRIDNKDSIGHMVPRQQERGSSFHEGYRHLEISFRFSDIHRS